MPIYSAAYWAINLEPLPFAVAAAGTVIKDKTWSLVDLIKLNALFIIPNGISTWAYEMRILTYVELMDIQLWKLAI